jgi:hypothetical protein
MSDAAEIIKSGAFGNLADIIHKLFAPMAEEYGLLLGDNAKVYRLKNLVSVFTKTQKILSDASLSPNAVPPRLALPILEASSLEDDETLQSLWAGLLATASQQTDSVSPSFVETLKQLTPDEARHLQHVWKSLKKSSDRKTLAGSTVTYAFTEMRGASPAASSESFERLGLIRRDYGMTRGDDEDEPEVGYKLVLTRYAVKFFEACNGPRPSSVSELNQVDRQD